MLRLLDTDRPVIISLLKRAFVSPQQVVDVIVNSSVSDAIRGQLRTETRDSAVTSLFELSTAANELPLVLHALAMHLPARQDIKQLILSLSERPGWGQPETISLEQVLVDDLQNVSARESGFERLTSEYDPFIDVVTLRECSSNALQRVCFIRRRSDRKQLGTGFLIGKDQVLTCYHVVEDYAVKDQEVVLRVMGLEAVFDFAISAGGIEPDSNKLASIPIDETYLSPFAPYSKADRHPEDPLTNPEPHELDYAVLKLEKRAGDERGYFQFTARDPELHSPVIIAQHPGDPRPPETPTKLLPLKVSFAQPGIAGLNANGTRAIYFNGTLPGSSGSPVFDRSGQVVAIHHNSGQLVDNARAIAKNNRGVPTRAILADLVSRGFQFDNSSKVDLSETEETSQSGDTKLQTVSAASTAEDLSVALGSMTPPQLNELVVVRLGERPDAIAAWALEPFSIPVLIRWAAEKHRLEELKALVLANTAITLSPRF